MTLTQTELLPADDGAPTAVVADVDGIPVSGLLAEAPSPRAVLVALHGGATTSAYFDCPGHPELSLLRTARRLGYTVLALDRPGYGSSGPFADRLTRPERRVGLMYGGIEAHLGDRPRGAGVFLVAHSAGCELALRMSAEDRRGRALLGVELAGSGRRHHPEAQRILWSPRPPGTRPPGLGALLWHPDRLYPPDLVGGAAIGVPGPKLEAAAITDWPDHELPRLAAMVRIPVRWTAGDHETVWRNDPEELAGIAGLFREAPRVVVNLQPNTGHNISLGYTAAAYHLKLLSFVEECAVAATTGEFSGPARQFDGGAQTPPGR